MVQPAAESIIRTFSAGDYAVLALLLIVCASVGIYHGFFRGKVTTEDYLMGGRNMKLIPTSLSLIATLISGTVMLGYPADTYLNGSQFVYTTIGLVLASIVMPIAFLPVLHKLKLTSGYQYLEMRFNKSVRLLISTIFVIQMIISIPRFIYPPAIVFNQVTGQNLHYGTALITIVCIFYTCVGGFKAVVWTDVIQSTFMYVSLIIVIVKGTIDVGGLGVVYERSTAGGRLEPPIYILRSMKGCRCPGVHYSIVKSDEPVSSDDVRRDLSNAMLPCQKPLYGIRLSVKKLMSNIIEAIIMTEHAAGFDPDPTIRYTFWSLIMGMFCSSLKHHIFFQSMLQRYLSLPDLKTAAKALVITNIGGNLVFTVICSYFGLLIYAAYFDCDPIKTKVAKGKDQVVPLFMMQTLGQYPGLPGVFVAGIFSAALSSMSSSLNALSAVILEDFYKTFIKRPLTQRESNILMKSVVIVFGLAGGALVFAIERIGTIFQITFTFGTMTDGPLLGVFLMGFFLPFVNTKGVLAGGISGLAFIMWIVLGSQAAIASGYLKYNTKPMSVEGCSSSFHFDNTTLVVPPAPNNSDVFIMYRLTPFWNIPMSCAVTMFVGVIVSCLTRSDDTTTVNPELLSPLVRKFVSKTKSSEEIVAINSHKPLELQDFSDDVDLRMERLLPIDGK